MVIIVVNEIGELNEVFWISICANDLENLFSLPSYE